MTGAYPSRERRPRQRIVPLRRHARRRWRARSRRAGYRTGAFVAVVRPRCPLRPERRLRRLRRSLRLASRRRRPVGASSGRPAPCSTPPCRGSAERPGSRRGSRGCTSTIRTTPTTRPSRSGAASPPTPTPARLRLPTRDSARALDELLAPRPAGQHAGRRRRRSRRVARRAPGADARPVRLRRDAARAAGRVGAGGGPARRAARPGAAGGRDADRARPRGRAGRRAERPQPVAVRTRGTAGRRRRRLLRGAQRQPHPALGAAHRLVVGRPQVHRPADPGALRPRGRPRRADATCSRERKDAAASLARRLFGMRAERPAAGARRRSTARPSGGCARSATSSTPAGRDRREPPPRPTIPRR